MTDPRWQAMRDIYEKIQKREKRRQEELDEIRKKDKFGWALAKEVFSREYYQIVNQLWFDLGGDDALLINHLKKEQVRRLLAVKNKKPKIIQPRLLEI